ncbi:MAG: OmpA family protein [Alphaproteobacteria bacterium]|nr:OmpA family protein [Alphaproteobacteria bacterium]
MLKKIGLMVMVLGLAACASSPYCKHKRGEDVEVRAVKTIPVQKLGIKVVDKTPVVAKKAPSVSYLASTLYFADGSAALSAKDQKELKQLACFAKEKNAKLEVYGYASSRTKDTDIPTHKLINFNVSYERAKNVANFLIKNGVKAQNIVFEALSDSNPVYSEAMPLGEKLNRRAEVLVSY